MKKINKLALLVFTAVFLTSCASKEPADTEIPKAAVPVVTDNPEVTVLFYEDMAVIDTGKKKFGKITAMEAVKDMTVGWNLGNTMDATGSSGISSETSWGQPKTTKAMIQGLAKSGIKTIRIPTSWAKHMDRKTYTIDPNWMERVKEIVDWAIEADMYVILNDHHDNFGSPNVMPQCAGYYPNTKNKVESERFLLNLWSQIALAFNNGYDEHLIFETLNEPRLVGTNHEWWFDQFAAECKDAAACLNDYNQLIVDTIRASGGNNAKRFISCPSLQASPDSAFNPAFQMPKDDEPGKLILSTHMYTPYNFAMASPGDKKFTEKHKADLDRYFNTLNSKFIQNGYPVIIGEMGATNKDNLEDRVAWFTYFISQSRKYGMTCCLWDNGAWDLRGGTNYNEKYGFYNRNAQTWYFPEITDAMVKAAK